MRVQVPPPAPEIKYKGFLAPAGGLTASSEATISPSMMVSLGSGASAFATPGKPRLKFFGLRDQG
jgi:hypothetical protein